MIVTIKNWKNEDEVKIECTHYAIWEKGLYEFYSIEDNDLRIASYNSMNWDIIKVEK